MAKKLTARSQFVAEVGGSTVVVLSGARFAADDPVVKAHRDLFTPEVSPNAAAAEPGGKRQR